MDSRLKSRLPRAHSSFCSARIMVMSLRTASARVISAPFIGGHRPSADEDVRSPCSFSSAHRWPSPVGGRGRPQSMLFQFRSSVAIARRRTRTSAFQVLAKGTIAGRGPSADGAPTPRVISAPLTCGQGPSADGDVRAPDPFISTLRHAAAPITWASNKKTRRRLLRRATGSFRCMLQWGRSGHHFGSMRWTSPVFMFVKYSLLSGPISMPPMVPGGRSVSRLRSSLPAVSKTRKRLAPMSAT